INIEISTVTITVIEPNSDSPIEVPIITAITAIRRDVYKLTNISSTFSLSDEILSTVTLSGMLSKPSFTTDSLFSDTEVRTAPPDTNTVNDIASLPLY